MVRKTTLIAVGALLAPNVCVAQTETTCNSNGAFTRCESEERPAGGPFFSGMQAGMRDGENRRVGKLLADGKCEAARSFALRAGRFDLVKEVRAVCEK